MPPVGPWHQPGPPLASLVLNLPPGTCTVPFSPEVHRMRATPLLCRFIGLLTPWGAAAQYDDPDPGPEPGGECQSGDVVILTQDNPPRFIPSNRTVTTSQTVCI